MKKVLSILVAVALVGGIVAGCSNSSKIPSGLSGSITISGSSALQPLVQAAADDLKESNSDLSITVNAGGSGTGLQNVYDKTVDIGNSDIFAEDKLDSSKASALVDHQVCVVGVAAVVNNGVTVSNLTQQQLIDIFTGKITNWKDVGGSDQEIVIINRPASSGTRALFKKYALNGSDEKTGIALTEDNSGTLKQTVAQTSGSIAYLAFSYTMDSTVKTLSIDGVAPTYDNIYKGDYNVWGYEHMYTYGDANDNCQALIDYITSDAFSQTVLDKGYGLISKMKVKR
ncbi:MAG: phosphate ABC transporter substrate-binding protein [Anaerofustis sp.]